MLKLFKKKNLEEIDAELLKNEAIAKLKKPTFEKVLKVIKKTASKGFRSHMFESVHFDDEIIEKLKEREIKVTVINNYSAIKPCIFVEW